MRRVAAPTLVSLGSSRFRTIPPSSSAIIATTMRGDCLCLVIGDYDNRPTSVWSV